MAAANKIQGAPLPAKLASLLREAKWLVAVALAAYLLLILFTFQKSDPGWSHSATAAVVQNAGGPFGAWLADVLLYLFGLSAYWWAVLFLYIVVRGYRGLEVPALVDRRPLAIALAGFALLILVSASIEALRLQSIRAELPLAPGGLAGGAIGSLGVSLLGSTGATLVLLTLAAVGFSLFTGISWVGVAELVGLLLEGLSSLVLRSWGERRDRKLGEIAREEREVVVEAEKKREEEHPPLVIAPPPAEIRKSERVHKEKQAPLFEDLPDTPLPPINLLDETGQEGDQVSADTLEYTSRLIEKKLSDFGISVKVLAAYPGPVITRYEVEPSVGVKGSQIVNLVKDLARALSVVAIRVVETIPGKSCMGLEIPNPHRQTVRLAEILGSEAYHNAHSPLALALGKDIAGNPVIADLGKMPHLLVAGTTGSGKSVAINAMILSLLYKSEPKQVRLILVDPKMLELSVYQGIPHLLAPVVTDMKQAANALGWCVAQMDWRYKVMNWHACRNLSGLNHKIAEAEKHGRTLEDPFTNPDQPQPLKRVPHIVVVMDELADLMMVVGKRVEELIARLAQKARAAGIHLILATQRPSVDVITGLIKANIPARIAFQVSSKVDSRTILDQSGAEALLGAGDMLYLPPGTGLPQRVHGAFVADHEVHKVVEHLKGLAAPEYIEDVLEPGPGDEAAGGGGNGENAGEKDPLYDQAYEIVVRTRRPSISLVQRHLRIGYNRAARLIEDMERAGVVSPMQSNGNREVLVPARAE